MQAKMQSKIAPKWLPGGSKIAPKWLPEGSRGPAESRSSFLMPFWPPLERSWALLGRSWGGLGTSWAAVGPSWAAPGGPPDVHFFKHFGGIVGCWARGLPKAFFRVCLCLGMVFLVIFLILSCFSRGDPGGQANFEKLWKTIVFFDGFAWVLFLRQVQREQISEHRRTKN